MKKIRPFFNNHQDLYGGSRPCFYTPDEIEGVTLLEESHDLILEELLNNLSNEKTAAICFRKLTLKKQAGWRQIELKIYGVEYPEKTRIFPITAGIVGRIPGVSTVYFSHLAPSSRIAGHVGDTDAYYRVHLGLKIPAPLPVCGLEVAGQRRSWQKGKCLAFNDIYYHSAWNDTDEERVVLIVDILRPEFRDSQVYIDSGMRATLYNSRLHEVFFPLIELLPRVLTRLIRPSFHIIAYGWHLLRLRLREKS